MAVELSVKYQPYVDEKFTRESKLPLLTNDDFDWTGAKTIKAYKVTTSSMNDYDRSGTGANQSRYGVVEGLDATTESFTLRRDRSFTFAVDKLDTDETAMQLQGATALERQLREVVIPEVDSWVYTQMCEGAGHKPVAIALTHENIYDEIIQGSCTLDNDEVVEQGRFLIVSPNTYLLMKKNPLITMETNINDSLRATGVIALVDGMNVVKVPANRVPAGFGFLIGHPCATVAPKKLEEYKVHNSPPGISGDLVEGRINYDAFVLENKACALYYQAVTDTKQKSK